MNHGPLFCRPATKIPGSSRRNVWSCGQVSAATRALSWAPEFAARAVTLLNKSAASVSDQASREDTGWRRLPLLAARFSGRRLLQPDGCAKREITISTRTARSSLVYFRAGQPLTSAIESLADNNGNHNNRCCSAGHCVGSPAGWPDWRAAQEQNIANEAR